uniref:Uncharacterized protein n=1 Tax=Zea mays TaxID=4577 RepID=B6TYI1_MAIZE|nr:hypothetical protein [Zea mays]
MAAIPPLDHWRLGDCSPGLGITVVPCYVGDQAHLNQITGEEQVAQEEDYYEECWGSSSLPKVLKEKTPSDKTIQRHTRHDDTDGSRSYG